MQSVLQCLDFIYLLVKSGLNFSSIAKMMLYSSQFSVSNKGRWIKAPTNLALNYVAFTISAFMGAGTTATGTMAA